MREFTQKETEFLGILEEARIATSHDDVPHVKPVSFVLDGNVIVVATDYNTRTFSNIRANPQTGIVIDIYKPKQHKAVCIQGRTEAVEEGPEFERYYEIFYKRFAWVRADPWKEGEAPFLKIVPNSVTSWGLDRQKER